jgi:hypothetical protein
MNICFLFVAPERNPQPSDEKKRVSFNLTLFCDPGGSQTPNLLIRSQMLYSVKLQGPDNLKLNI